MRGALSPAAVLEPAPICVELVAGNAAGANPAGDGPQFAGTDQRADVVLGALQLRGDVLHGQGDRALDAPIIAG